MNSHDANENREEEKHEEPFKENLDFWARELSDLDVSTLPDAPPGSLTTQEADKTQDEEIKPLVVTEANGYLIIALLENISRHLYYNPKLLDSAMLVCRLANGDYRLFHPAMYSRETILNLAKAAVHFHDGIIDNSPE